MEYDGNDGEHADNIDDKQKGENDRFSAFGDYYQKTGAIVYSGLVYWQFVLSNDYGMLWSCCKYFDSNELFA